MVLIITGDNLNIITNPIPTIGDLIRPWHSFHHHLEHFFIYSAQIASADHSDKIIFFQLKVSIGSLILVHCKMLLPTNHNCI